MTDVQSEAEGLEVCHLHSVLVSTLHAGLYSAGIRREMVLAGILLRDYQCVCADVRTTSRGFIRSTKGETHQTGSEGNGGVGKMYTALQWQ